LFSTEFTQEAIHNRVLRTSLGEPLESTEMRIHRQSLVVVEVEGIDTERLRGFVASKWFRKARRASSSISKILNMMVASTGAGSRVVVASLRYHTRIP